MPVERTELRGAAELEKHYEVYETIGSGNVVYLICIIPAVFDVVFKCLFIFQVALPKSSWVGIF